MKYIKTMENFINESNDDYKGCLMAYIDISKDEWYKYLNLIDEDDLFIDIENDYHGLEKTSHCTILYGLNVDINRVDIKMHLVDIKKFKISSEKVSSFDNDKFDVLKFQINSKQLKDLNKLYRDNFDYKSNYDEYNAHITIAYLKPGTAKKYIKLFNEQFIFPVDFLVNRIIYTTEYDKPTLQVKLK